ncbi:hypothetical protein VNO78_17391 [Psophocarpus tetragonolobus]|uniref:Uncharacterized protein n=1 Tax=Psophocarpus tetragonolobus TaxID=3891 RepID=A0AAN9XLA0_PSOTE
MNRNIMTLNYVVRLGFLIYFCLFCVSACLIIIIRMCLSVVYQKCSLNMVDGKQEHVRVHGAFMHAMEIGSIIYYYIPSKILLSKFPYMERDRGAIGQT